MVQCAFGVGIIHLEPPHDLSGDPLGLPRRRPWGIGPTVSTCRGAFRACNDLWGRRGLGPTRLSDRQTRRGLLSRHLFVGGVAESAAVDRCSFILQLK
ncbi:MAG: hypothetical protein AAF961_09305, partial [Planctomycetota bacterium]